MTSVTLFWTQMVIESFAVEDQLEKTVPLVLTAILLETMHMLTVLDITHSNSTQRETQSDTTITFNYCELST